MNDQGRMAARTTKEIARAAEAAAGWPSVRSFLQAHPNLLLQDGDLLQALGLRIDAPNVVPFGRAALARDAQRRETKARMQLEATAHANFAAQTQCHAGVVDLLESRNNADLARRVDETAQRRLGLAAGALAAEGRAPAGWRRLEAGMVDALLGEGVPVRLGRSSFTALLFPETAGPIESCALVRLALWTPARPGILAFGAADPDAFSPDMGVDLIAFIARVVERTAGRWPVL
jgi:uncharacterized protein YigA (DUF484 family)